MVSPEIVYAFEVRLSKGFSNIIRNFKISTNLILGFPLILLMAHLRLSYIEKPTYFFDTDM